MQVFLRVNSHLTACCWFLLTGRDCHLNDAVLNDVLQRYVTAWLRLTRLVPLTNYCIYTTAIISCKQASLTSACTDNTHACSDERSVYNIALQSTFIESSDSTDYNHYIVYFDVQFHTLRSTKFILDSQTAYFKRRILKSKIYHKNYAQGYSIYTTVHQVSPIKMEIKWDYLRSIKIKQ